MRPSSRYILASLALSGSVSAEWTEPYLGKWDPNGLSGVVCIHTILLPNSKMVCIERPKEPPYGPNRLLGNTTHATEIDLMATVNADGSWTSSYTSVPTASNPFCAGHAQMANGSVLVVGGDLNAQQLTNGIMIDGRFGIRMYTPCAPTAPKSCVGTWHDYPGMSTARWYPTITTLYDGRQMILSGVTDNLDFTRLGYNNNPTYEYFPAKPNATPRQLQLFAWAYPFHLYPLAYQMPSGNVFVFASNKTVLINPDTDEVIASVPDLTFPNHAPWMYPTTPTGVILPLTIKNNYEFIVQICGGNTNFTTGEVSDMCVQINPESRTPAWKQVQPLPHRRVMPDVVILPDGKLLYLNGAGYGIAGGNAGDARNANSPVYDVDLYDPETDTWETLAPMTQARLYHSGAVLLESGHVVTTGSEMDNWDDIWNADGTSKNTTCFPVGTRVCKDPYNYNIERFTPPYLERASTLGRPVINFAPTTLTFGSSFIVSVKGLPSFIKRVSFIRYTTTTHSTNVDQRFVELRILYWGADYLIIDAPRDGKLAPPGNWMLFLLDANNIPSVARTINLQSGEVIRVPIPSSPTTTTTAASNIPVRSASAALSPFTNKYTVTTFIGVILALLAPLLF